jgi:hypothetical protein
MPSARSGHTSCRYAEFGCQILVSVGFGIRCVLLRADALGWSAKSLPLQHNASRCA